MYRKSAHRSSNLALEGDLTVGELAALLKVHPETVRIWLRFGKFSGAYRLSKRAGWRIPQDTLETFRKERQSEQDQ